MFSPANGSHLPSWPLLKKVYARLFFPAGPFCPVMTTAYTSIRYGNYAGFERGAELLTVHGMKHGPSSWGPVASLLTHNFKNFEGDSGGW